VIIENWDTIVAATTAAWDAVLGAVQFVWNWIKANWPLLLAIITGPIGAAVLVIVKNWSTIKDAAEAVWDWLNGAWQTLTSIITAPIRAASDIVSTLFGSIESAATSAYDWVKTKFDAMGAAISAVVGAVTGAVSSVVDAIKGPINAVIGGWNNLAFTVPTITLPKVDLGPLGSVGGQTFGGQRFDFPNLPTLAAGGVLTSATLFVGGETGTEIVTPEALMRQIIRDEGGGRYTLNLYPRTADAADIAYGFRRLELMAGIA
jgi:hypothetical protein